MQLTPRTALCARAAVCSQTVNGDDVVCAMQALGFDRYVEPLKVYLAK
jgi:histone H3/H4